MKLFDTLAATPPYWRSGKAKTDSQDFEIAVCVEVWVEINKKPENPATTRVAGGILAERAGFEPAVGITPRTLSRRVT